MATANSQAIKRFEARPVLRQQRKTAPDQGAVVLGEYVTRWRRWAKAGVYGLAGAFDFPGEAEAQQTGP